MTLISREKRTTTRNAYPENHKKKKYNYKPALKKESELYKK